MRTNSMKWLYGMTVLLLLCCSTSGIAAKPWVKTRVVYLGNTPIKLVKYQYKQGKNFVHVHQNETTAKRAALTYIKRHGGSLLTLVHPGDRNIRFVLRHQRYAFDPNRIYSKTGIKKTLRAQSHYSPAAAIEVRKLAQAILHFLPKGKIIAVHNNQDYSMVAYFPGHGLAGDARAIQFRHQTSLRNFYLVTKKHRFIHLERRRQNVIWQSSDVQDDGSLSVYLAKRDYVNVEAAYHAFRQQLRMLRLA